MSIILGMKKMLLFSALLVCVAIGCAVWFSPLAGNAVFYADNGPCGNADGLCYAPDACVRADFATVAELFDALDKIGAREVYRAESGGTTVIYAYSDRVCAKAERLGTGEPYNVMAAYSDGSACMGTPVLQGCY